MSEALSVGVIMDGNRRWAKAQGLPTVAGHEAGSRKVREIVSWALEANISHLYLYAFSTENWKRTDEEVSALLELLSRAFTEQIHEIEELNVRIRIIGERHRFSAEFQEQLSAVEERSKGNAALTVVFCLSYGSRAEIAKAAQVLPQGESDIAPYLDTRGMPDPDIIIRPGGEKRLSNFLLYQSAYAELFFSDTLWPDFTKEEFSRILEEFRARERRRGK